MVSTLRNSSTRCDGTLAFLSGPRLTLSDRWCVEQGGVPRLVMNKTQLEGEQVTLKRPFAVMQLHKPDDGSREYHTVGVVRQKLVFKSRPAPARPQQASPATTHGSKRARTGDEPPTG